MKTFDGNIEKLANKVSKLRGSGDEAPKASIVIPVNAQGDLENILNILDDITQYSGQYTFEIILVINNYPPEEPPAEIKKYSNLGINVISIPYLKKVGEAVGFTARIPGVRAAKTEYIILFDADCRIPNATKLLDWYVKNYDNGIETAYTHVDYYDLRKKSSIKARMIAHHFSRWVKRKVLGIPTVRGSNYAIKRSLIVDLYDQGFLADDMNVGPVVKSVGAKIAYSNNRELVVLTSGRMFSGSWVSLAKYLIYRLKYNVNVLPARRNAAKYTGRTSETDPNYLYDNLNNERKYIDNKSVNK